MVKNLKFMTFEEYLKELGEIQPGKERGTQLVNQSKTGSKDGMRSTEAIGPQIWDLRETSLKTAGHQWKELPQVIVCIKQMLDDEERILAWVGGSTR